MHRKPEDFLEAWQRSSAGTLAVLKAMTDDKMGVSIVEGHSSLGWLAWHLVGAAGSFGRVAGLNIPTVERGSSVPSTVAEIVERYEAVIEAYNQAAKTLTEEKLAEEIDGFMGKTPRGKFLSLMIEHQAHHRGQMTVLLRQSGLPVPGVMGPTKEMLAAKK